MNDPTLPAGPEPVTATPRAVRPPYSVPDPALQRLAFGDVDTWRKAVRADRLAALLEPLAGVEVSDLERSTLQHLAAEDVPTVAAAVRLLHAARAAAPLTRVRPVGGAA